MVELHELDGVMRPISRIDGPRDSLWQPLVLRPAVPDLPPGGPARFGSDRARESLPATAPCPVASDHQAMRHSGAPATSDTTIMSVPSRPVASRRRNSMVN